METKPRFEYKVNSMGVLYYSLIQSGIEIIPSIILTNNSDESIKNVSVNIEFAYDFVETANIKVNEILPNGFVEISPQLVFNARKIFDLTEKFVDTFKITFYEEENVIGDYLSKLIVLPPNQWSGSTVFPETIAGFVMPNIPEISLITARAAEILKKKTGSPSFTGYLSGDKNRVLEQLSAIYGAIYELNIVYSVLPASFEQIGQRIRTPQEVYNIKQANCIEMSLLFASVCESVGLNPILVFVEGHAFVGCWLSDELFDTTIEKSLGDIKKRLASGIDDLVVLEATYMNQGSNKDFDKAMRFALNHLEDESKFHFVTDIKRCHYLGITPMPIRLVENGEVKIIDYGYAKDAIDKATVKADIQDYFLDTTKKEVVTKSVIWMRNLLDLSKRNSLISFRPNVKNIQLFTNDLGTLEDYLAKGDTFTFAEVTGNIRVGRKNNKIVDVENENELKLEISKADFKAKKIRTYMEEEELNYVLKTIYRENQKSIEENGASSLFLALGFLKWIDPKDSLDENGNPFTRYAPLILLPVELIRKNLKTYEVKLRDEDSQMNITLLEFLRQQFELSITGLNPLPEDSAGVDVKLVFNSIRKAVMNQKGWDVLETAVLGHFSFSQFVMWNDLKERFDKLTESKIVKGLVDGMYIDESDNKISEDEIDTLLKLSDIAIPTDIDSSQLAAVVEASRGRSFVLHGPPGTGKSQTITNMIANAMYQGKSILFVAEKMAALSVVYNRLAKLGLEDFCLEIHSNKTSRRVVLEKFEKSLELRLKQDNPEFERKNERLEDLKNKLNMELVELHKVKNQGYSLYDLISMSEKYPEQDTGFTFDSGEITRLNSNSWDNALQIIKLLSRELIDLRMNFKDHPLREFNNSEYSLEIKDKLFLSISKVKSVLEKINDFSQSGTENLTFSDISVAGKMLDSIQNNNIVMDMEKNIWDKLFEKEIFDFISTINLNIEKIEVLKESINKKYSHEINKINVSEIRENYLKAGVSILFKGSKIKTALLPINAITKNGFSVDESNADSEFANLMEYIDKAEDISVSIDKLENTIGYKFNLLDKNISLIRMKQFIVDVISYKSEYGIDNDSAYKIYRNIENFDKTKLKNIINDIKALDVDINNIKEITNYDLREELSNRNFISSAIEKLSRWSDSIDLFKNYTLIYKHFNDLSQEGLPLFKENLIKVLKRADINYKDLEKIYMNSILNALIKSYISETTELTRFNGIATEERIREYNVLVDEIEKITLEQIKEKLIRNLPSNKSTTREEAVVLANLTKTIRSKGRGTSIRKIFQDNGSLIKSLTPCLLMSPLSVAQYIDLDFPKFDLVIFDEASQIRTGIAVGAMSRAKDCIIVGDPNQMPPTSFFSNQSLDEENIHIEDLESLLEDALAINMPQKYLTCHYRSKSESLIAFSNSMYYGNKMLTFPAPDDAVSKVTFVKTEGIYDRGGSRTNKEEAKAVVNEILRRLENREKSTIGVVTFNATQQELIDDLLQEEFIKRPKLEKIASEMKEPIFIKNLENVQGDERDVILFSITYGKDINGKFYQNFGPLSNKGGWRRLNVAVSRSRSEMMVFSSFTFDEINISATTSEGVVGLKTFLEFAQKGISVLQKRNANKDESKSEILYKIKNYLEENGFDSEINFGASKLTLEIVVKHKEDKNRYICSVLLDSKQYADKSTARDRNRMIPKVLSGKGWHIYRIWALEYFENKEKVLSDLKAYLEDLMSRVIREDKEKELAEENKKREQLEKESAEEVEAEEADKIQAKNIDNANEIEPQNNISEKIEKVLQTPDVNFDSDLNSKNISSNDKYNLNPNIKSDMKAILETASVDSEFEYVKYEIEKYKNISINDIFEKDLIDIVDDIIKIEAPIVEELLIRRVIEQFKESKVTANIRTKILSAIQNSKSNRIKDSTGKVYYGDINPYEYKKFRLATGEYRRDLDMICDNELANKMLNIAKQKSVDNILEIKEEELVKLTIRAFGFMVATAKATNRMTVVERYLFNMGYLKKQDDKILIFDI